MHLVEGIKSGETIHFLIRADLQTHLVLLLTDVKHSYNTTTTCHLTINMTHLVIMLLFLYFSLLSIVQSSFCLILN